MSTDTSTTPFLKEKAEQVSVYNACLEGVANQPRCFHTQKQGTAGGKVYIRSRRALGVMFDGGSRVPLCSFAQSYVCYEAMEKDAISSAPNGAMNFL